MKSLKNIAIIALLILVAVIMIFAAIDIRLYLAYTVLAIAVLALAAFIVFSFTGGARKNIGTLVGAGGLFGLMLVFYLISPKTDVTAELWEKTGTGMGWSPIIGSGLYTIYALIGVFVALLAFFSVKNMLNK